MLKTNFTNSYETILRYASLPIHKLLVLGAGNLEHEQFLKPDIYIAVEWADDRLETIKNRNDVIALKYNFSDVCSIFPSKSFDSVILYDAIEHLEKKYALALLHDLESVIKKQIIIFTPLQPEFSQSELDFYREKQYLQIEQNSNMGYHLSTWTPNEFENMGYHGEYSPMYHKKKRFGAIVAVKNL